MPVSERSYCGKCGHPVATASRFCGECGAPIANAGGGDFNAYDISDLGPTRVSLLANSDEIAALLANRVPLRSGWYPDPLEVGWAREFDGESWLGFQRRVLTEAERADLQSPPPQPTIHPTPRGPRDSSAPPPPSPENPSPEVVGHIRPAPAKPTNSAGVRKNVLTGIGCGAAGILALGATAMGLHSLTGGGAASAKTGSTTGVPSSWTTRTLDRMYAYNYPANLKASCQLYFYNGPTGWLDIAIMSTTANRSDFDMADVATWMRNTCPGVGETR